MVACCRVGSISTDEQIEIHGYFGSSGRVLLPQRSMSGTVRVVSLGNVGPLLEPGNFLFEVGACEFVVEVKGDVWHSL